jgi:hypothetical protein
MAMLTHTRGVFERAAPTPVSRHTVPTTAAKAQLAAIKRFALCLVTVLVATGALAAIIALKAAIYLSRVNY